MAPATKRWPLKWTPSRFPGFYFPRPGHNTIFDVEVAGQAAAKAMIVDWQREPLKDQLIHIDLKRIALDKLLQVSVRVKLLGIPMGVRTAGGILDQVLREVEIECLPADIPSHIDVDVSNLEMHGVLRVSDLPHSDKIKYLNSEDATVAHVVSIREEVATCCRRRRRWLPKRATLRSRKWRRRARREPEAASRRGGCRREEARGWGEEVEPWPRQAET